MSAFEGEFSIFDRFRQPTLRTPRISQYYHHPLHPMMRYAPVNSPLRTPVPFLSGPTRPRGPCVPCVICRLDPPIRINLTLTFSTGDIQPVPSPSGNKHTAPSFLPKPVAVRVRRFRRRSHGHRRIRTGPDIPNIHRFRGSCSTT